MSPVLPRSLSEQARLIRKTGHVHGAWYRARYADVDRLGMDPAEHYLKYGAALGRDPGKDFDTAFYLAQHPLLAAHGVNPLLHYALHGRFKGYPCQGPSEAGAGRQAVDLLRYKLLSLGFTERPLAELAEVVQGDAAPQVRAQAARELAMWHMREGTEEGYRRALGWLGTARPHAHDVEFRCRLATLELLCHHFLGQREAGLAAWDRAAAAGEADADVLLARVNFETAPGARVALINRVLGRFGIPPVTLLPGGDGRAPYDRLAAETAPAPVAEGPLVSVLVAAYDAADTLPTALRSLSEQSWRNLEILVLDDCSPDGGATARVTEDHAARDPRIRLIRMERNGGAYVARNRGLDEAQGVYVTLHDADDWSHPVKIETQVRHLEDNPDVIGCTSDQARASSDLDFTRWTARGQFLIGNTSSFMFRRDAVRRDFGYWDTVRFSADNELIRRIRRKHGQPAVTEMQTGPLSFQRDSASSIIANKALGISGFMFGVRKEYLEAQRHHRAEGGTLKYGSDPAHRPFPVPVIMRPERKKLARDFGHSPVIFAGDFRLRDEALDSCLADIAALRAAGLRVGLIEMRRYDLGHPGRDRLAMTGAMRQALTDPGVQILGFGEEAACDLLVLRDARVAEEPQRYLPSIAPDRLAVIADRAPDDIRRVDDHLQRQFGRPATWYPAHALARGALAAGWPLEPARLSGADWPMKIDPVAAQDRPAPPFGAPGRAPLVIGRHTPDGPGRWPAGARALLAAYPADRSLRIEVLGAAETPAEMLGALPASWTVHGEGAMSAAAFLARLDAFVHIDADDRPDPVRRPVLEAMAAGVPVILPEAYRPLFGDAALYVAAPEEVSGRMALLAQDAAARNALITRARAFVASDFGHYGYCARLQAAGLDMFRGPDPE
ncbi:glycosyltransferase [Aestuariicoccus sp. MJ-SS9]|uniref:glycosyltransferase n=1 Tax=Aestuariicoccus sp. MJ-SS9 TaxID=3079855 RepID=UPI002914BC19|nr:glycosyltransferase [Aestuariicoccus sp. MJ-SS9]MDU8912134.1 glycosyltransferase [Aestuariicoccus sp. MJ-SS9]